MLTSHFTEGETPTSIAQGLSDIFGVSATRAQAIARTETMRAYRTSTQETFRENDDVIKGWRWVAALTYSTCIACLMQHGQEFPLDTPMDSHVNCRCMAVPITKTFAELGAAGAQENDVSMESGQSWFERQPAATQRQILGQSKYDAYREGKVSLHDLVAHKHSDKWGGSYQAASLREALQSAKGRGVDVGEIPEKAPRHSSRDADDSYKSVPDYELSQKRPIDKEHYKAVAAFDEWDKSLSEGERAAINLYAGDKFDYGDGETKNYVHFNDYLRNGTEPPAPNHPGVMEADVAAEELDAAVRRSVVANDMTTYRAMDGKWLGKVPRAGDKIDFPGISSSSIEKDYAMEWLDKSSNEFPVVLQIEHPAGTRGAYIEGAVEKYDVADEMKQSHLSRGDAVKEIREFSQNEFLLPDKAAAQIMHIEKREGYTYIKVRVIK